MRNTLQYILKKLLFMIPMVLFITFLIYLGLYLTPGDAISYMFSPDQLANIDPAKLEELRELYGLNDPFFVQYFKWLWQLLCGNFGYSLTNGQPISSLLKQFPGNAGAVSGSADHLLRAGQYPRDTQCSEEGFHW